MDIPDSDLGNVAMALELYSQFLNDNKPSITSGNNNIEIWEHTRREVWALRDRIESHYKSLPSLAEY